MKLDWDKLGARERDAVVCKFVFGVESKRDVWDTRSCDELTPKYDHGCLNLDGSIVQSVPYYTSDIRAAWLVVERMREKGWLFNITEECRGRFDCWFSRGDGSTSVIATSSEAPEAICLAALRAMGVEV